MTFDDADILESLAALSPEDVDGLPFGVIMMEPDGTVVHYNKTESQLAGLSPSRVVGLNFFADVAPCTNNYLVAGRFEEDRLDERLDYVFTLRMKPTNVTLRLLKSPDAPHQYVLVARR